MVYFCGYELSNDDGQKWKFSSEKRSKFQILGYRSVIYLKRKLRTYTIKIQPEKVRFLAKKKFFFWFFNFLPNARGPPKIFDAQFSNTFKKNPKMACLAPVWYQKEQSHEFWWTSPYPCGNVRLFLVIRAIMAPPAWNRVKNKYMLLVQTCK